MKKLYHVLKVSMLLLVFAITSQSFAQGVTISGKVTDSKDGSTLPGVSVVVKGTTNGTVTDMDGKYSLNVNKGVTLVFSFVGYQTQEIVITNQQTLNVSMVASTTALQEVVVVAYGTRKKADLTGAVTSVSQKEFQKGNIASSEQLLIGKVAGLQITSGGGEAGGGSTIRIRGGASLNSSNDPLIVIDGVPVAGNSISGSGNLLNTINPNDIESISVLKDASATALYGSRASNGVLIITTKKGTQGAVKFNYNSKFSAGMAAQFVDVLSADQIRQIINADATATGKTTYKNLLGNANTDWQKVIYHTAWGYDNNLSASGSVVNIPYRVSAGYLSQDGIIKTDHFNRFSSSVNLTPKFFTDHLSVALSAKFSRTQNRWADEGGAVGGAVGFDPTQPVFSPTPNKFGGYYEWINAAGDPINTNGPAVQPNPLSLLEQRRNTSQVDRFIGNVQLDYKLHFFPDLHVMLNLGLDKAFGSGNDNRPMTMASAYSKRGIYSYYQQGKTTSLTDVSLFYTKEIASIKSKIDVLALHSYGDFFQNSYNYPSYNQAGVIDQTTVPRFATDKPEVRLESYLGRLNYTLNDKYLLTASIRRDASSKFSPENRVGYFPAVALAWRLNEEFFKNTKAVTDLKLRLGWGETGQQDGIAYYSYLPNYSRSTGTAQYQFGTNFYGFLRPSAYDANLKWESTTTNNIGLDFGFFENRLTGSVELYQKKTKDLLSIVPIAPGANFDIVLLTNVGNMENKGVEVNINTVPVKKDNFSWEFGFNVTYNETKITNLLKQEDPNFKGNDVSNISGGTGNYIGKQQVGYAPFSYFVYKQIYDKTTGKPIEGLYEDANRDGAIDANDKHYYKKPAPDFMLGITTQFTYKKWNLGLAAHGMLDNYLYNNFNSNKGTMRAMQDPLYFISNVSADFLKTNFKNMQYLSDYYIENASFFRLDNINLGYNVGKLFYKKVTELRVTASVQNVFFITKYSGLDPENSDQTGVDRVIYPRPRVYSLGFNFDF